MTFPFPGEPTPENLKRFAKAMERFKSYEDKVIDEYVVHFGEDNEKEIAFIHQALQQLRTELIACLPDASVDKTDICDCGREVEFRGYGFNECRDQFLTNLKNKGYEQIDTE